MPIDVLQHDDLERVKGALVDFVEGEVEGDLPVRLVSSAGVLTTEFGPEAVRYVIGAASSADVNRQECCEGLRNSLQVTILRNYDWDNQHSYIRARRSIEHNNFQKVLCFNVETSLLLWTLAPPSWCQRESL